MKFSNFLEERYLNFFKADKEEREQYKDEVYELLQSAYAGIGGLKGSGFNSADDMVKNIPMWKLVKKDNKIIAGVLYKDKDGRKSVASFTNGSKSGLLELSKIFKIDGYRAYTEISSKALTFAIRSIGIDEVKKIAIPVDEIKKIMKDDEFDKPDQSYIDKYPELAEFFYARKIGSSFETKIAIGSINKKIK